MKSFETYRFKARLTKAAHKALDEALEVNRLLYNALTAIISADVWRAFPRGEETSTV